MAVEQRHAAGPCDCPRLCCPPKSATQPDLRPLCPDTILQRGQRSGVGPCRSSMSPKCPASGNSSFRTVASQPRCKWASSMPASQCLELPGCPTHAYERSASAFPTAPYSPQPIPPKGKDVKRFHPSFSQNATKAAARDAKAGCSRCRAAFVQLPQHESGIKTSSLGKVIAIFLCDYVLNGGV